MRPARVELNQQDLEAHLERARAALGEEGYKKLKAAVETLVYLTRLSGKQRHHHSASPPNHLRTEYRETSKVLKTEQDGAPTAPEANPATPERETLAPGHERKTYRRR